MKVSGYRVETEEVEAILQTCPDVAQASVVVRPSPAGDKQLVAYCVPEPGADLSVSSLRAFMRERAPGYMVPALFVTLQGLPLNEQGKVDRGALPEAAPPRSAEAAVDQAPRDALEVEIASIWKRLFAVDSVGIHDDFFDLGGHSLLAFRFFAALEESTGARLPLATLFEAPTIERLAALVRDRGWQPRSSGVVPLKSGGSRPPIFLVHAGEGNAWPYRGLARHLDPDQPVFVVEAKGLDGEDAPLTKVEDMAALYVTQITAVQPHGPYILGGSSIGGVIAFEMARRLVDRGEPVSFVALFDSFISQPTDISRVRFHAHMLLRLPPRKKLEHIRGLEREISRRIRKRPRRLAREAKPAAGKSLNDVQEGVNDAILLAATQYPGERLLQEPYPGKVTSLVATDRANDGYTDPTAQWEGLVVSGVETIRTPGGHVSIMLEPHVKVLAEQLAARLGPTRPERRGGLGMMVSAAMRAAPGRAAAPSPGPPRPDGIKPAELHLWSLPFSILAGRFDELNRLLSEDERARAARYRHCEDSRRFILGRGLLRELLAGYTGIPAAELVFSYGPSGKPGLGARSVCPEDSSSTSLTPRIWSSTCSRWTMRWAWTSNPMKRPNTSVPRCRSPTGPGRRPA